MGEPAYQKEKISIPLINFIQAGCYLNKHTAIPRIVGGSRHASMPRCLCCVLTPGWTRTKSSHHSQEAHPAKDFTPVHFDNVAKSNQSTGASSFIICSLLKLKLKARNWVFNKQKQQHQSCREQTPAEADITASNRHQAGSQEWVKFSIKDSRFKALRINYEGQNIFMREI